MIRNKTEHDQLCPYIHFVIWHPNNLPKNTLKLHNYVFFLNNRKFLKNYYYIFRLFCAFLK